MSIKKSLVAALLLFSTVPMLIVVFISVYNLRNTLVETQKTYLETLACTNGMTLNEILHNQKREADVIAESHDINRFMETIQSDWNTEDSLLKLREDTRHYLQKWVNSSDYFENVILADNDGTIVLAANELEDWIDISNDEFFKQIIGRSNDITQTRINGVSYIVITSTVENGMLALFMNTNFIDNFLHSFSFAQTGKGFIVDNSGTILYHIDPEYEGTNFYENSSLDKSAIQDPSEQDTILTYTFEGVKRMSGFYKLDERNWTLIVQEDYEEIVSPLLRIYWITTVSLGIILVLTGFASIYFTKAFSKPVIRLKQAFEDATVGNNYKACDIHSKNEFGDLADNFNIMLARLNKNYKELSVAYSEIEEKEKQLYRLAYYDKTTGLINRSLFDKELAPIIAQGNRGVLVFINLDDFGAINNLYGRYFGDDLLKLFADRLQNLNFDITARISGDEFLLLKTWDSPNVDTVINDIMASFKERFIIDEIVVDLSASIGIANFPDDGADADILIKKSEMAMQKAKQFGKKSFAVFNDSVMDEIHRRNEIKEVLKNCLKNNELFLVYQPEVDINSRKIIAFETLMRINSKKLGRISPAEFIPIAEASGYISKLGYWALKEACLFAQKINSNSNSPIIISVNVSSIQIRDQNFVEKIINIINSTKADPNYIQLELTESVLMQDAEDNNRKLEELRIFGITIALDDFGTSYSSLSYLFNISIDVLKMDKSFIDNICTNPKKEVIAANVINMAHSLNYKVIAEGVEYEEEFLLLKKLGCDVIQGFFFSPPVESAKALDLVADQIRV